MTKCACLFLQVQVLKQIFQSASTAMPGLTPNLPGRLFFLILNPIADYVHWQQWSLGFRKSIKALALNFDSVGVRNGFSPKLCLHTY